jgi:N-acetylglutamate synthase-like GNAT family acetyltransferase
LPDHVSDAEQFRLRRAEATDVHHLIDIDLKCFDEVWTPEDWRSLANTCSVVVATLHNNPIAMCVHRRHEDGYTEILKLGVKNHCRRKGVGRALIAIAMQSAIQAHSSHVFMLVPEHLLRPGEPQDVSQWLLKMGFRAEVPLVRNAFVYCGVEEAGVKFTCPVPL